MNTDCAFCIGATHDICQDYALAGKTSIAVSDGCSGSPRSDIGSRVLSITAMNKMTELESLLSFDEKECILLARPAIKMLNIPNECLDATLLSAILYEKALQAMCCGDGIIAIKLKDGNMVIIDIAYKDSYPFYMNYLYDSTGRYKNWITNHNKRKATKVILDPDWNILSHDEISGISRLPKDIGIIRELDYKTVIEITDKSIIEYIALMTDGVHSFYETITTGTAKFNSALTSVEVLEKLLSFKNFNTSFVQRRMNKFRKDCLKNNWGNADDLSLAVIYLGEK